MEPNTIKGQFSWIKQLKRPGVKLIWSASRECNCHLDMSIPFFSQLSDSVFYSHFTLYTLTKLTPKKCRPMNSGSQSRNYTVFVSGLIVHLFVMRNCRHWPCSRWLTCVYRACTSDGKWSSFLGPMAKWLCDLCKFHSNCNTGNVNVTCFGRISSEVTFNRYKIG